MATRYVRIDRQTPMLLPPDMKDWISPRDLAHFVVAAVEACDLGTARANPRGTGDLQYPPAMLLALLISSYATGTFSSRAMERATYDSVATRYLCANHHPDHDTIAKFRRENGPLLKSCFVAVLQLAKAMGLVRLGTVSVDGTKIAARAGKSGNRTRGQLEEELARLEGEVEGLLAQAREADLPGLDDGRSLPEELADRGKLLERLRQAKEELDRRQKQRKRAQKKGGKNGKGGGGNIHPVEPESALMRTAQGPCVQGYNAQAAVSAEGLTLIVGAHVVNAGNDRRQLAPTVKAIPPEVEKPEVVVADRGYDFQDQIDQLAGEGIKVYCPPQKIAAAPPEKARGEKRRDVWEKRVARREELRGEEVRKIYGRRAASSEPCFHVIKRLMGLGRFMLRGLEKVNLEWDLAALAYNCRKIAPHWA